MERAGEYDDVRALRERLGDLDRVLIRLGAAVREIRALLRAAHGCDLAELLREAHIALVRHDVEHAVEIFIRLLLDGRDDLGMAVPDVEDADAADPVEEMVAVEILDDRALRALHHDGVAAVDRARHDGLAAGNHGSGLRSGELRMDFRQCISEHDDSSFISPREPALGISIGCTPRSIKKMIRRAAPRGAFAVSPFSYTFLREYVFFRTSLEMLLS